MDTYASITMRQNRGHTLIELMVAIVIGILLVLGAFTVLASFEGRKRTTTAMNDALQSGGFGLYQVDKMIRSAGTGLGKYATMSGYGCALNYTPPAVRLSRAASPPRCRLHLLAPSARAHCHCVLCPRSFCRARHRLGVNRVVRRRSGHIR